MSKLQDSLKKLREELAVDRGTAAPALVCAFCGFPQSVVPALLTGPGGAICSDCLEHAHSVVLPGILGKPAETPVASHRKPSDPIQERTRQTRSLLEQVDDSRGDVQVGLLAFVRSLENFLESASSEKLLLCLPWPELKNMAATMRRVAATLDAGEDEADAIAKK